MTMIFVITVSLFLGTVVVVASNPSPCFGGLLLMIGSCLGCLALANVGDSFLSLILFLIYLGGMLVLFAFSAALSSDLYPKVWHDDFTKFFIFLVLAIVGALGIAVVGFINLIVFGVKGSGFCCVFDSGFSGLSLLYSDGGIILVFMGFVLLLTLFVVLELVRGVSFGAYKS